MHIEAIIADLSTKIERNRQYVETTLANAKAEGRANLTPTEDAECERRMDAIDADKASLERARAVKREEDTLEQRLTETRTTGAANRAQNRTSTVHIGSEARVYNRGNDPDGTNFLRDVARATVMGDPESQVRLARHMQEERVERPQYAERTAGDLLSTGIGGIMVPNYLVEMTALASAARRPFADACTKHSLPPDGMSLVVPTFTTPTSVANQTTQLTTVSGTSMVESDLTLSVYTAAGFQNVSRQAVDRSRIDQFVLQDLMLSG